MKFESCPRCNGNWESANININDEKIPFHRCITCDINYYDNREEIALRGYLKPSYNLVWFYNEKCCRYGSLEDVMYDKVLLLPWLPFSITRDRLKLLLLFS